MRCTAIFTLVLVLLALAPTNARAADQADSYWFLIHDRALLAELKLTETQRLSLRKITDELDGTFMVLRGQSGDAAAEKFKSLTEQARTKLQPVFKPEQHRRLAEVSLRMQGTASLLRPEVVQKMKYTAEQQQQLEELVAQTKKSLAEIDKAGGTAEAADKERTRIRTDEQKRLAEVLSKAQQNTWRNLVGASFDTSKLGRGAFKAPELAANQEWLNSKPLELAKLRGQVVALHFYACGCINCIHNYPSYRKWQDELPAKGVMLLGIHTPETNGERVVETVRKKAQDEKLAFPIVIDNDKANWTAWGNTMWPTVYLIDKQGYVRYWWMGELNWQGAEGEKLMRQRIDELLAE